MRLRICWMFPALVLASFLPCFADTLSAEAAAGLFDKILVIEIVARKFALNGGRR